MTILNHQSNAQDTPTHINTPSWLLNKKNALVMQSDG